MSVDSPLENTVNANPLRILRAAAPELSGIRVGWRCTTVGLCSIRLYQDASYRPHPRLIPPPDRAFACEVSYVTPRSRTRESRLRPLWMNLADTGMANHS